MMKLAFFAVAVLTVLEDAVISCAMSLQPAETTVGDSASSLAQTESRLEAKAKSKGKGKKKKE